MIRIAVILSFSFVMLIHCLCSNTAKENKSIIEKINYFLRSDFADNICRNDMKDTTMLRKRFTDLISAYGIAGDPGFLSVDFNKDQFALFSIYSEKNQDIAISVNHWMERLRI